MNTVARPAMAPAPRLAVNDAWDRSAIAFLILAGISLLILDLIVEPSRFYDYDTYLIYLDDIFHFRQPDWFLFEGAAKAYLLLLREIFGTTRAAIEVAHYLLLLIFAPSFFLIFRRTTWEAAVVATALFAPQLGLVTIRATPAYIICTIAAIRCIEQRGWGIRLTLLATAFHVSAFLALIPILAIRIIAQTRLASYNLRFPVVVAFAGVFGLLALVLAQGVFDFLTEIFQQIPYLEKYSAYAVGLSDPNAVIDYTIQEETSANHYVFLAGAAVMFGALTICERERTLLKLFGAISFILYLAIFFAFSPIPAFRFAPFFALPILAMTRISERFDFWRRIARLPFLVVSAAVFTIQVALVID